MQFSETWLKQFINYDLSAKELSHKLTMAGIEVEKIISVAPPCTKVIVGQILEVAKHPNADRLQLCKVDVALDKLLQIICGAKNVAVGIKVPCALVGATLPVLDADEPRKIKLSNVRGLQSEGMLCSAEELLIHSIKNTVNISNGDGLLILDDSFKVGLNIRDVLELDDNIFILKLTPNRADCLSVYGVAREIAAIFGANGNTTSIATPLDTIAKTRSAINSSSTLSVNILAENLCGHFTGKIIRNVNVAAKIPEWMAKRLAHAGQRQINALVDISNYVMLEIGQPSHVFDLDKIQGKELFVRQARSGEKIKLLNDVEVELHTDTGIIADTSGPIAIAGIMGGAATAVSFETKNIYLEAAFWFPDAIAGKARRYNISSGASHRFERGVDYNFTSAANEYISKLILEICGGQAEAIYEYINLPKAAEPITVRTSKVCKVLGVQITAMQIAQIFTALNFKFTYNKECEIGSNNSINTVFQVTPPSFRFDLKIEADLFEEIARLYGYDNIPANAPVAAQLMLGSTETCLSIHALRKMIASRDYQEVLNFSFVAESWEQDMLGNTSCLKINNPISQKLNVMRSSLMPSLLDNIIYNYKRKVKRIRLFEIANVFLKSKNEHSSLPIEVNNLAVAAYGPLLPEKWNNDKRMVDYFDLKGDLESLLMDSIDFSKCEHPLLYSERSAQLTSNNQHIGYLGQLHPSWQQKLELPYPVILLEIAVNSLTNIDFQYKTYNKLPEVTRDLSLIVRGDIPANYILKILKSSAFSLTSPLNIIKEIRLFDIFINKNDERSLSFTVIMQSNEFNCNLEENIIDAAMKNLLSAAQTAGASLRSLTFENAE